MKRSALLFPLLMLLMHGCVSYVPVAGGDNFAYLYGKGAAAVRVDARAYNPTPDRTVIYFKLHTRDLLYKSAGGGGLFHARVLLKYEAYPSMGEPTLLDSASTWVKDSSQQPDEDKELIGSIDMHRNDRRTFVVKITATDENRDTQGVTYISVERGETGARQDYLPLSERGVPIFGDEVRPGTTVRLRCEQLADRTIIVRHFSSPDKLPAPVFVTNNEAVPVVELDTSYFLHVDQNGVIALTAPEHGFLHFLADTSARSGYTLFTFNMAFPTVSHAEDLVPPLRYITSLQEWERITTSPQPRSEIERFWTDAAGSRERARELIEAFYGRVESANRHFSSWTEGWRTDRGLVHIIFGTPNTIHRTATAESWTYGEESNLMSLTFVFQKREGSFSDNDMVLRRDPMFKTAWYRNVESWRNGRIFQN
jgi:GWxTD domain-containing protein